MDKPTSLSPLAPWAERARHVRGSPWFVPGVAGAALVLWIVASQIFGFFHAAAVVTPEVRAALQETDRIRVAVRLGFPPEQYNLKFLQSKGSLGAFDESSVFLSEVSQTSVDAIGAQYWVDRVDLWAP